MAKKDKPEKEKRTLSAGSNQDQDFYEIRDYHEQGRALFYLVSPTNISVLSHINIEIKIRHLMMVLSISRY